MRLKQIEHFLISFKNLNVLFACCLWLCVCVCVRAKRQSNRDRATCFDLFRLSSSLCFRPILSVRWNILLTYLALWVWWWCWCVSAFMLQIDDFVSDAFFFARVSFVSFSLSLSIRLVLQLRYFVFISTNHFGSAKSFHFISEFAVEFHNVIYTMYIVHWIHTIFSLSIHLFVKRNK